jgi:transcriptional regulator with XRE-family HTH domain
MLRKLGLEDDYARTAISNYERGEKEPPLTVLLRYAQVANICLDVLADDKLSLPHALPAKKKNSLIFPTNEASRSSGYGRVNEASQPPSASQPHPAGHRFDTVEISPLTSINPLA